MGRTKGWSERGEKGGRPVGSFKGDAPGRKTFYKTISVICSEEERELIRARAEKEGKSISRLLIDLAIN